MQIYKAKKNLAVFLLVQIFMFLNVFVSAQDYWSQMPFGKWVSVGEKTMIEMNLSEDMNFEIEIRSLSGKDNTVYSGRYRVPAAGRINFSVNSVEIKRQDGIDIRKKQQQYESWTVDFSFSANGRLEFTKSTATINELVTAYTKMM